MRRTKRGSARDSEWTYLAGFALFLGGGVWFESDSNSLLAAGMVLVGIALLVWLWGS